MGELIKISLVGWPECRPGWWQDEKFGISVVQLSIGVGREIQKVKFIMFRKVVTELFGESAAAEGYMERAQEGFMARDRAAYERWAAAGDKAMSQKSLFVEAFRVAEVGVRLAHLQAAEAQQAEGKAAEDKAARRAAWRSAHRQQLAEFRRRLGEYPVEQQNKYGKSRGTG